MEFYENDEADEESYDLYASDDTSESDFDELLVDNINELELYSRDGGFTLISLIERAPVAVFKNNKQNKTSRWKHVSKKEIESFHGLNILMGINNLSNMKLYWSKDIIFHNTFISSIMSRNHFLQIFYNIHVADSSLEPKRESKDYSKIYKIKNFSEILRRNFQKNYNFDRYDTIDKSMINFKRKI